MQKVLLIIAAATGILIAYVDSRPTWDDAGITAGALLLGAAIIGFFIQRHPWVYGISIGMWIPLVQIYRAHDFSMLVILLIPLIGAYAGWGCRKALRNRYHPA